MILGISPTFDECNRVVEALETERALRTGTSPRTIVLNAHQWRRDEPLPKEWIVYNFENPHQTLHMKEKWKGVPRWDFNERAARETGARFVPVGWHPLWESPLIVRERRPPGKRDVDVAFFGCMNERRLRLRTELLRRGLRVEMREAWGQERDKIFARCRIALNMLCYEGGVFPALRAAPLIASCVPTVNEEAHGAWKFLPWLVPYTKLPDTLEAALGLTDDALDDVAENSLEDFARWNKMSLPP